MVHAVVRATDTFFGCERARRDRAEERAVCAAHDGSSIRPTERGARDDLEGPREDLIVLDVHGVALDLARRRDSPRLLGEGIKVDPTANARSRVWDRDEGSMEAFAAAFEGFFREHKREMFEPFRDGAAPRHGLKKAEADEIVCVLKHTKQVVDVDLGADQQESA